jgi:hypothetical protein
VSGRTGSVHDKTAQELEKACIRAGDIELNFAKDEPLDYHVKELYLEDTFTERAKRGAQPAKLFILEPAMYILCMYSDGRLALWDINRDGNVTTGQHVARVAGNVDVGITYTTYYTALNIVVHATLSVLVVSMVNSYVDCTSPFTFKLTFPNVRQSTSAVYAYYPTSKQSGW